MRMRGNNTKIKKYIKVPSKCVKKLKIHGNKKKGHEYA